MAPKKGYLVLYTFQYSSDSNGFHEGDDEDLFVPDGKRVAYIISNYSKKYHPDWVHCMPGPPKPKTSNRGRKKKPKRDRVTKRNNGDNTQFSCAMTLGVIMEGDVYNIKVFRKKSGNISSVKYSDPVYVARIIDKTIDFLNDCKTMNMKITLIGLNLRNVRKQYPIGENQVVNLSQMREWLKKDDSIIIDGVVVKTNPLFNNIESYLNLVLHVERATISYSYEKTGDDITMTQLENTRIKLITYHAKLDPAGHIYVYGGNEQEISDQIIEYVEQYINRCVQTGYRTINKDYLWKKWNEFDEDEVERQLEEISCIE